MSTKYELMQWELRTLIEFVWIWIRYSSELLQTQVSKEAGKFLIVEGCELLNLVTLSSIPTVVSAWTFRSIYFV
jgi:hypothetical protein